MSFIFRAPPACADDPTDGECDAPSVYICGRCGVNNYSTCEADCNATDPNPEYPLACPPCYTIREITVPAISFTGVDSCGDFTLAGGTTSLLHDASGLLCLPWTDCPGSVGLLTISRSCTWGGFKDATAIPIPCVNDDEYCDGEDNLVFTADAFGQPAYVGTYSTSGQIGCYGSGGGACTTHDTITAVGVWASISVIGAQVTTEEGTVYGRKTQVRVYLCPYLEQFGCYTNYGLGYGAGGADEWIFEGTSDFIRGCGCPSIPDAECGDAILCSADPSATFEIPSLHHSRRCVGCDEGDVPASYTCSGDNIGDISIKLGNGVHPCGYDGSGGPFP